MKAKTVILALTLSALPAGAAYAPIPEHAQGRAFSATLNGAVFHDSNVFGSATDEIDSMVYRVAPTLAFNSSVTDQTFVSLRYGLTFDRIEDRPGERDLVSHSVLARLAHTFSPRSELNLNGAYQVARNPESLLAGVPLHTDQSFASRQVDGRWTVTTSERLGFSFMGRNIALDYDNAALARELDRDENLVGAALEYFLRPKTRASGEYRYQEISYDTGGRLKDKTSHFLLAGLNHALGPLTVVTARAGLEARNRAGAPDEESPYAEVSGRYAYGEKSHVAAGYALAFEEPSSLSLYTDVRVHRWFAEVQHAVSPFIIASGLLQYEPSVLQGRAGVVPDRDETTTRAGVAVTYLAIRRWAVTVSADFDHVDSEDLARDYDRTRFGLSGRYDF